MRLPSCFKSDPSPQAQAENCCHDCWIQEQCFRRNAVRPTGQELRSLREKTGCGLQDCRRLLNSVWRKARLKELTDQLKAGQHERLFLGELLDFLEIANQDYEEHL